MPPGQKRHGELRVRGPAKADVADRRGALSLLKVARHLAAIPFDANASRSEEPVPPGRLILNIYSNIVSIGRHPRLKTGSRVCEDRRFMLEIDARRQHVGAPQRRDGLIMNTR